MHHFQKSITLKVGITAGLEGNWDLRWLVQEYDGSDCERFGNTKEYWREL